MQPKKCPIKRFYIDMQAAQHAASVMRTLTGEAISPYYCSQCRTFHLTGKRPKVEYARTS